jgi:hypothetical protein
MNEWHLTHLNFIHTRAMLIDPTLLAIHTQLAERDKTFHPYQPYFLLLHYNGDRVKVTEARNKMRTKKGHRHLRIQLARESY